MCVTEHLLHSWQGHHRTRQAVHKEAAGRERIGEKQTRTLWETGLAWGWMTRGMIPSPLHTSLNREAVCTKHNNPSTRYVPPPPCLTSLLGQCSEILLTQLSEVPLQQVSADGNTFQKLTKLNLIKLPRIYVFSQRGYTFKKHNM